METSYIKRLADVLAREKIEAALIGPSPDLAYLTGLSPVGDERFKGLFVLQDGRFFYVASSLYAEESERCLGSEAAIYVWEDGDGFLGAVQKAAADFGLTSGTIAVNDGVSAIHLLDVQTVINARYIKGDMLVGELRIIKSEQEREKMRKASAIIDQVVLDLAGFICPGLTEKEISARIEELCYEHGATGLSFKPITASGPNSSMPHYNDNRRVIQERDIVLVDLGCKYDGYCSDTTRTFFVGEPTEKERAVYEIVLAANLAAEAYAKAGAVAEDVDRAARQVIEQAGYGPYFITRTGHGIGTNVHEHPNIVAGNKQVLADGMAFSIEPGIYLPGEFGVRIEDIVLISGGAAEILNQSPKELTVL